MFVAVGVLLALVAVDIAAYSYITRLLFSQVSLDDLEYRSSYVGLDELYESGQLKPIRYNRTINMPRSAVQVYQTYPDKMSPQGDHQWLSDFGTLAPPDRHLQVNGTVSAIFETTYFGLFLNVARFAHCSNSGSWISAWKSVHSRYDFQGLTPRCPTLSPWAMKVHQIYRLMCVSWILRAPI